MKKVNGTPQACAEQLQQLLNEHINKNCISFSHFIKRNRLDAVVEVARSICRGRALDCPTDKLLVVAAAVQTALPTFMSGINTLHDARETAGRLAPMYQVQHKKPTQVRRAT